MPRKKNKDDYLIRQAFTPEGRMQQLTKQAFDLADSYKMEQSHQAH